MLISIICIRLHYSGQSRGNIKNNKLILHISKRNEIDREGFVSNILDVYSMEFNPVEALAADVITLPFPEEKSLDRLYKFRRLLPEAHPDFNIKVNLGKIVPSEKAKDKGNEEGTKEKFKKRVFYRRY